MSEKQKKDLIIEVDLSPCYFSDIIYDKENNIRFAFKPKLKKYSGKEKIISSNLLKYNFTDEGEIKTEIRTIGNKYKFGFISKDMLEYFVTPSFKKKFKEIFDKENKKNLFYILEKKETTFFSGKDILHYVLHYYATDFKLPKNIKHKILIKRGSKFLYFSQDEIKKYKNFLQNTVITKQFNDNDKKIFENFLINKIRENKERILNEIAEEIFYKEIEKKDRNLYSYLRNIINKSDFFKKTQVFENILSIIKENLTNQADTLLGDNEIQQKIKLFFKKNPIEKDLSNLILVLNNKKNVPFEQLNFKYIPSLNSLNNVNEINSLTNVLLEGLTEKNDNLKYLTPSLFFIDTKFKTDLKNINFPVFQVDNGKILTNISSYSDLQTLNKSLQKGNIKSHEYLLKLLMLNIKDIEKTGNNVEEIKDKIFDLIEKSFSPIQEIDLNTVFEDFSSLENNNMVKLENLFKNPLTKTILLDLSGKKGIFKALAEKYKIDKNTFKIMINALGEDFSNVSDVTLNENNLGILKYAYMPIVKIETEEEKESFYKKFDEYFKNKFQFESDYRKSLSFLEEIVKKGDYIIIGTEIKKEEDVNVFESVAKPLIINKNLDKKGYIDIPITEYEQFLTQKIGFNIKKYIKHPNVSQKMFFKIMEAFLKERTKTYQKILGIDMYNSAFKMMKSLSKIDKTKEKIDMFYSMEDFINFSINYFGEKYYKQGAFNNIIEQCNNIIESFVVLSPIQKEMIKTMIKNPNEIDKMKKTFDQMLLDLKEKYPNDVKNIEDKITLLNQKIDFISKSLIKEAKSFISFFKIFYYREFLIRIYNNSNFSEEEKQRKKIQILTNMWNEFQQWGTEAVGLTQEQFQDAFNAFILDLSKKKNTIAFGYSMGTGKTRLTLFFLYLNSLFAKKSFFFIQNKNKNDIEEQLKDMLLSLNKITNKYFSFENDQIPFDIIENIIPNFFNSKITKHIVNSESFSVSYLKEKYYSMITGYYDIIKDMPIKDIKQLINQKHYKNFINDIDEMFDKEIKSRMNFFDFNLKTKEVNSIYDKFFKNYAVSVFWAEDLIKNNNIPDKDVFLEKISKKVRTDLKKIFSSLRAYLKEQKNNNIALCSNFILSHFPKNKNITSVRSDENSNILTNDDIDILKVDIKSTGHYFLEKEKIISLFYKTYETDFSEYAIMPFYNYFFELDDVKKTKMYIDRIFHFENIECPKEYIEKFAAFIMDHSKRFLKKIPFIKVQNAPLETECIKSEITEEIIQNNENINKILNDNEKIKNIILNFNKYLNNFAFASGLALFYRNDVVNYEKETFFNMKKIYKKQIAFSGKIKENILTPVLDFKYNGEEVKAYIFQEAFGSFLNEKNISYAKKAFFPKAVEFNFNGSAKKIILDFYNYRAKKDFNLNVSFLFTQNPKGIVAAIDESHKNNERNLNFFRENIQKGGINVPVSGTIMNGTPEDIVDKLIFEKNTETIKNILQTNMGIFSLETVFLWENLARDLSLIKDDLNLIKNKDKKIRFAQVLTTIEKYINFNKNILSIEEKKFNKIRNNIAKYIYENLEKLKYLTAKEIFLNAAAINNLTIKKMPGISNPTAVSTLTFNYPELTLALKDATDRIWDFHNIDKILDGRNPVDGDYKYLEYLNNKNSKLKDLYVLFDVVNHVGLNKKIKQLKENIDDIISQIVISKQSFDTFKTFFNLTDKQIYKIITPQKASQNDTIGNIFLSLIKHEENNIPSEKIDFIKNLINLIKNNSRFQKSFIYTEVRKIFETIDIDKKFNITVDGKIIPPYIKIDLSEIFNIFKDKTDFYINLFGGGLKEIQTDILNSTAYNIAVSAVKGFNPVLFSTRVDLLILKTAETLDYLLKTNMSDIPTYLLLVKSNSYNFNTFIKNIDEKLLAKKNIYIKNTDAKNFYNNYNYNIPYKANIITAAIYSVLAEGYRLNRFGFTPEGKINKKAKIFYVGKPSNVYTTLQSAARCYSPIRQKDVSIYLSSEKYSLNFNQDMMDETQRKKFNKEKNKKLKEIFFETVLNTDKIENYADILANKLLFYNTEIKTADNQEIIQNTKHMRNLLRSIVTMIEFLGGKINVNIKNKYSNNIVYPVLTQKNEEIFKTKMSFKPDNKTSLKK